jgi:hypothetical protein
MTEKQWRVRFFGRSRTTDHTNLSSLPQAVRDAMAWTFDSDVRKPFVYFDDHARGPVDCLSCGAGDPADESCCNGDCFCHERAS